MSNRRSATALAGLVALTAVLVMVHIRGFRNMSPIDETQHYDYLESVADGDLVRRGDHIGSEAMEVAACRGFDPRYVGLLEQPWTPPACDGPRRLGQFPQLGYNTAWRHPPTYYGITAAAREVPEALSPVDALDSARLTGIAWLVGGVLLIWLVLGWFDVALSIRAAAIILLVSSPGVLFFHSVVTEDATGLVAGAGVLAAACAWMRDRVPAWVPIAASFVACALKWTNAAGVGVAAAFLVLAHLRKTEDRKRSAITALSMGVAALAAIASWYFVQDAMALVDEQDIPLLRQQHVASLEPAHVAGQFGQIVTPFRIEFLPPRLEDGPVVLLVGAVNLMMVFVLVWSVLRVARAEQRGWLAVATGGVMLMLAPLFVLSGYVLSQVFNQVQPRFGLSIVPAMICVYALTLRGSGAVTVAWILAGAQTIAVLRGLL